MKKVLLILFMLVPFIVKAENCTVVSGNGTTIGDEISCGTEHFYVIDSNETDVQALAKYNISVGDKIDYFAVNETTTYTISNYDLMHTRCEELATEKGYTPYFVYSFDKFDNEERSYTLTGCRVYERMNSDHIRQDARAIGTKLDGNGKSILPIYGITYMVPSWGYEAMIENNVYINDYDSVGNLIIEGSSFKKYLNDYKSELNSQNITTSKVSFPTLDIMKKLLTKIGGREFEVALEYNSADANDPYNVTYENYVGKMDIKNYIPSKYNWIYNVTYWLGSGYKNEEEEKSVYDYHGGEFNDYYITNEGLLCSLGRGECGYFDYPIGNGLRPLITLPISSITIPAGEIEPGNETIVDNMYNITSETDGNGSIEVVKTAHGGDKISFRVSTQPNFKISSLTIFDKAGNALSFNEDQIINNDDGTISINSFTMPSNDVKIIAKFESIVVAAIEEVLINPKTGVFSPLYIMIATLVISGIVYYVLCKKHAIDIRM